METTIIDMKNQQAMRISGRMPPEYYERTPVFDHEYIGPRFIYGLVNGTYTIASVPKGEILDSYKPDNTANGALFGTIEYPYALTDEQIHNFKLIDLQQEKIHDIRVHGNYHAVFSKSTGGVIEVFPSSREALELSLTFNGQTDTTYISKEMYDAFKNGAYLMRKETGEMEIIVPTTRTIDPAAEKYMQDRQRHNDEAEEHNRLRKLGQDVVPGIRFQDAADAGRVYEMKTKGELSQAEWNDYVNELDKSGKANIPKEYVIYSKFESNSQDMHIFWSKGNGWTSLDNADKYTAFEIDTIIAPDADNFAIKHSIAQKLDDYIAFGSNIDLSKLRERMDELNKNADSASDALGMLETQFQTETNLFGDAGTGQSEDISRIKKLMNEMEAEWEVLNNLEVSFDAYNHINKSNEFKSIKSDKNDFADFVNKYDYDHVKGYSPKESVIHINNVAQQQGLNAEWTYKEHELYGEVIEGKFTKYDSNNVGTTEITKDGKARFFYNNERIKGYYASTDDETQEAAIKDIAILINNTNVDNITDYDKIKSLATTLAKAETVLSYNEISTLTGLNKDDIETHWTVANYISDKAKERSEKHNGNTKYKDLEYEINFLTWRHFNTDKDKEILNNLSFIFPEDKQDQDGEVSIELVKPSDANSPYEIVTLRPILNDDENILPENSFNVKHYMGIPSETLISDSEHIKHEFTFSVDETNVYAYWMQNGQIYKDALRDFGGQFYDTPENIKNELLDFTNSMKERIMTKTATEAPKDNLTNLYTQGREAGQYAVKNDLRGKELAGVQWKYPFALDMYHHGFTDGVLETITPSNNSDLQFIKNNNTKRGIANKGEIMFIHTENSFDEFRAVVLAVARYNVNPQTGEKLDTYAELKKHGFTEDILNRYHAEAVKLVDETISADLRPNSYSLIQTMHGRVWDRYDKIRGDNYLDKAYENMPLQNGDLATGEVSKNSMDTYYKAIDKDGNEYVTNEMPLNKYLYNPVQTELILDIDKPILDKNLVETLANKYVSVNIIDKQTLLATINEYPETPMKSERISEIYSYLSREEANILSNFSADHKEFYEKLMVVDKNMPEDKQIPRDIRDIARDIQRDNIKLDTAFFDKAFTNPMNNIPYNIPKELRAMSEEICTKGNIKGICDPMYIVNISAFEMGRGDGQSNFMAIRSTASEDIDRVAERISLSYGKVIDKESVKSIIDKHCSSYVQTQEEIEKQYKITAIVKENSGKEIRYGFDNEQAVEKIWNEKYKESGEHGWRGYSIIENQKQEAKYFAVDHDKSTIIAEGMTTKECSDKAAIASNWNQEPGSHAPYSITNKDGAEHLTKTLPNLSKDERQEYTTFVDVMKQNYPDVKIEDINKLCGIAHEMAKYNQARSTENGMTEEKFIEVTDRQEVQIDSILKQMKPTPGQSLDYEPRGAAIKLELPQGQRNNISGYAVPEIPIRKLEIKHENVNTQKTGIKR